MVVLHHVPLTSPIVHARLVRQKIALVLFLHWNGRTAQAQEGRTEGDVMGLGYWLLILGVHLMSYLTSYIEAKFA
jgi:hypothetical protein